MGAATVLEITAAEPDKAKFSRNVNFFGVQSNTILDVHSLRIGRERFAPESL